MKGGEKLCPYCDVVLDSRREVSGKDIEPTPGDYSICVGCTNYLLYDDDLNLVKIPEENAMPEDVLEQLMDVKFQIDMRKQMYKFGQEFQKMLNEK